MIHSLTIKQYRNARPCTLHFDPRLTVVLGSNETGRTTLLEVIRDLSFGLQRRHGGIVVDGDLHESPIDVIDDFGDGTHHRYLDGDLQALLTGRKQTIITTQNPWAVDRIPIDDEQQMQRRFILTKRVGEDSDYRWAGKWSEFEWRNPTAEESALIVDAYSVGIQHVSEVLRDRGLW